MNGNDKRKVIVWETLADIYGGQKMSLIIADYLSQDFNVIFIIPGPGKLSKALDEKNIRYMFIGDMTLPQGKKNISAILNYLWISIRQFFRILNIVKKEKPAIIYLPGPASMPLGTIIGSLTRTPVIWHLHHMFTDKLTLKLLSKMSRLSSVKKVIAISNCVKNQIDCAVNKGYTIYNPVDFSQYQNGNPKIVKDELNLPNDAIIIGHIGILQPDKKQVFTLNVAKELLSQGHKVYILFIGSSRSENNDYTTLLENKIKELELTEYVCFLGQRSDMPNILPLLSLVIIPSIEGLSLVALEAAVTQTPIVSTDIGGGGELINRYNVGYCFKDGDAKDASEKILKVLEKDQALLDNLRNFEKDYITESEYKNQILKVFAESIII